MTTKEHDRVLAARRKQWAEKLNERQRERIDQLRSIENVKCTLCGGTVDVKGKGGLAPCLKDGRLSHRGCVYQARYLKNDAPFTKGIIREKWEAAMAGKGKRKK